MSLPPYLAVLVRLCILPLLLLVLAGPAAAAQRVEIVGAGAFTALLNEHLDIVRHGADGALSADEWRRLYAAAPAQVRALLATEGHFSAQVTATLSTQDGMRVARLAVEPGVATLIGQVEIVFSGALEDDPAFAQRRAELRAAWALPPGLRFRQADWASAKTALQKAVLEHDFPAAALVDSEAVVDPAAQRANLRIALDSGPAFRFGALDVHGLERYPRELVERLNPIRAGEPFAQERLTELQARLQDSGYFLTVFATIDADPEHATAAPVRVDLAENTRRRLSSGIGFSTDAGARLQAKWLDRSFLGHDWLLNAEARIDRQSRLLSGDLQFPARDNGWRPGLGARFERSDISNEITDKLRVDARLAGPSQIDEQVFGLSWLTERQYLPGEDANNRQALIATFSHTRRRVDNLINPSRGYVAGLELGAGLRGPFNEANIARAVLRANGLFPLSARWQAQLRGQLGQVFGAARERVPSDLLFRTGGDQAVRGYGYNSIGVAENGAIVGGRVLAVASAEAVYAVTPTIGAAVFRDAGDAADRWNELHLKQGTGVGARWRTPIGAVNLDVAFGHATRQLRLHFSVGYGF